jgi:hypothetical protein
VDLDEVGSPAERREVREERAGRRDQAWVVRVGDELYIRSWKGRSGAWFRHASTQGTAHISAAGVDRDVTVSLAGTATRAAIDQAYQAKYARHGRTYVVPMTAGTAAETTIRLTPAD